MPGLRSLQAGQYYAHPQNSFWKILGHLYGAPVATYPQRIALVKKQGLALWETLKCCERSGSLDANIDTATIEVNDFEGFLKSHPGITRIFFNGATSEKEFMRRVLPTLAPKTTARLFFARLPSTSPAHASMHIEDKIEAWSVLKD
jgi:hypoxanthine-DNA glycosylase